MKTLEQILSGEETAKVGEAIYDFEASNMLKVRRINPIDYLIQNATSTAILKDISKNGENTFKAGTHYQFLMNVPVLEHGKASTIFGFSAHNASVGLKAHSYGYEAFAPFGGIELRVLGMDQKPENPKMLQIGAWYIVHLVLTEDRKVMGDGPDPDFTRGVNLSVNLIGKTEVWFAEVDLRGERFNSEFVGKEGSRFYARPGTDPLQFGTATSAFYKNMLHIGDYVFELNPINSSISPEMIGFPKCTTRQKVCVSEYFQKIADSDYGVHFEQAYYYMSKSVYARKIKSFRCTGTQGYHSQEDKGYAPVTEFWSDKNITFIYIQTFGFDWKGGYFNSRHIPMHDKAFFEFDMNVKTGLAKIDNVFMEGKMETLYNAKKGTKGIFINLEVDEGTIGFTYNNTFSNIFGAFLNTIVDVSGANEYWRSTNTGGISPQFINLQRLYNIESWGCKQPVRMLDGGACWVECRHQSMPVLCEEEKDLYPIEVWGNGNIIDVHSGDGERPTNGAPYRHGKKVLYAPGAENTIIGRTFLLSENLLNGEDFARMNHKVPTNSPEGYYLGVNGVISDLNSSVRYAGDFGKVSYKGYLAPSKEWFDANLTTNLEEDKNGCLVEGSEYLLNSNPINVKPMHTIKSALGFAEVVIDMPIAEDIYRLQISLNSKDRELYNDRVQIIGLDSNNVQYSAFTNRFAANGSLPLPIKHFLHKNIKRLTIRFIGSTHFDIYTQILDIAVVQKGNRETPVLNISNQTQRKTGPMIFDKPMKTIRNGTSELVSVEEVEKMIKEQLKVLMKK